MLALYRCGRQAEALAVFAKFKATLADELGLEPSRELTSLENEILLAKPELDHAGHTGAALPEHTLPRFATRLIGREVDVAEVRRLLESERLVTLAGAGGAGKTRLAVEVARQALPGLDDGAWFVDLARIDEPAAVAATAAADLGLPQRPDADALETLVEHLADKRLLLVLDNCEHVLESAAELASAASAASSGVRVLATSRAPLGSPAELAWRVPSLDLPDADAVGDAVRASVAVQLFAERAKAVDARFEVTAQNAAAVVGLCRRLDGIPLALELAAGRLRYLDVAQLVDRLDERLALVATDDPAAPARQRTLRAVVEWSYDLLPEPQQAMLRRLAVFPGGADLASAEHMCGAGALDTLMSLMDHSLVALDRTRDTPRYRLSETVRSFALERLAAHGEDESAHDAHAELVLDALAKTSGMWDTPDEPDALRRLDELRDDLPAATSWLLPRRPDDALALTADVWQYWYTRGTWRDAWRWLAAALAESTASGPTRLNVLAGAGRLADSAGDNEEAEALHSSLLELARAEGDGASVARALVGLGHVALNRGSATEAERHYNTARDAAADAGADLILMRALIGLGNCAYVACEFHEAKDRWLAALALSAPCGRATRDARAHGQPWRGVQRAEGPRRRRRLSRGESGDGAAYGRRAGHRVGA